MLAWQIQIIRRSITTQMPPFKMEVALFGLRMFAKTASVLRLSRRALFCRRRFSKNSLSGTIPKEFGQLTFVQYMSMYGVFFYI